MYLDWYLQCIWKNVWESKGCFGSRGQKWLRTAEAEGDKERIKAQRQRWEVQ